MNTLTTVALHHQVLGQGEPVLILHGFMGSADNWRTLGLRMASQSQVWLVDQRNHGHSPHTDAWDYPHMAADVLRLMDEHRLDRVSLIGHSMGGKTAMQLAAHHPDRVEKLVVVDISTRQSTGGHEAILNALQQADITHTSKRHEVEAQLKAGIPNEAERQFILKALYRDGDHFAWRFNLPVFVRQYPAVLAGMDGNPVYPHPTRFIKGGASRYIQAEDWPEIQRLFPQAQLEVIAGAGHWVHAQAPAEFLAVLNRFLNKTYSLS
ncbi:MAG: alpha/beta fold hydrolase [Sphingobacteriia bacterium]|jgi:esterase